jgi:hypothetical protein
MGSRFKTTGIDEQLLEDAESHVVLFVHLISEAVVGQMDKPNNNLLV